jgi:DNA helicase HerA-like ATPase
VSLRQTQLIAAAAARVLQHYGREMTRRAEEKGEKDAADWLSLLFLDEAHLVAPNDDRVVSSQVLRELARMGRHSRTGMIVSSQSPADLDTSLLKRMQTRLIFALEKDQLKSISGVTSDLSQKLLDSLPKLPRGVCAVSGSKDVVGHGFLMKVRSRKTRVSGGTPPIFDGRKKAKVGGQRDI